MGKFKEEVNYVAHDFNTTTLTIDGTHVAEGLDSVVATKSDDRATPFTVGDGTGLHNLDPSKVGTFVFAHLEASATTDKMNELWEADESFDISLLDSNAVNLDTSAKNVRIINAAEVARDKEAKVIEWTCSAIYMKIKGGSYALKAAE